MKIEVLFPEICNLFGELANIRYLESSLKESGEFYEITYTSLKDEPLFASEKPDLIYMGGMSEHSQSLVVDKLMPYRDRIIDLIKDDTNFLITSNALEIFGERIEFCDADYEDIKGLSIFPTVAKNQMYKRFNCLYLGKLGDMEIVGFKSQFGHSYLNGDKNYEDLFETIKGTGLNPEYKNEGIKVNGFLATYVVGPILVLNPDFTKALMKRMGVGEPKLAYEEAAYESYNQRLNEYKEENRGFYY
ncbi:MAG: hypothetical protein MJ145_00940 [Clostridia bacterium]|nr:hypothetical protein [Clostridia bacterium]